MSKKIFVGNLDFKVSTQDLNDMFSKFGNIEDAIVISERDSGRSKGFGFITFSEDSDADKAISEMNGTEPNGRKLTVNEAEEKEESPRRHSDREHSDKPENRYYTTKEL